MIDWLLIPFRIVGLLVAAPFALWAFASFMCIWHGSYSHSKTGKAGFSRSFGYCAMQGIITLIVAAILVYFSVRHY